MGDENPIYTLGHYSKPSHEGYRNTIELPARNNVYSSDLMVINWDKKSLRYVLIFPRIQASTLATLFQQDSSHWEGAYLPIPWPQFLAREDYKTPQYVPSTSDCCLIELENQVQRLMEAYLAPTQPTHVNKITTSCEICNGPHDTHYCMENPEQVFVEYASSHTDEAGGLVSNFMASQDARLSKFKADFKQQQSEMTNKIDTVLKAITDRIAGTLPSDTVKNPKLGTHPVLSARQGFLATANAVIDYRMAKIAVGEGITRSVFGVKGVDLGKEEAPYWTTLGKSDSYKPRPSSDGVGAQTPYYARKDFLDCHIPGEWEISRDVELNPFKDTLVFRRMVEFLGAIPISLKCNIWESVDLIKNQLTGINHPKMEMEHGMPRLD
ncbi:hypothetical protein Tco_1034435 [Tanacetum coccineum]